MSNMSYCRFENAARDLKDCADNWDDEDLNNYEHQGKLSILRSIRSILNSIGCTLDEDAFQEEVARIEDAMKAKV